jgi:hypothetical protein
MTKRESFIAALNREPPAGRVPHFELEFFLTMEALGRNVEVHMHEPMTVQGDVTRIARWAEIAREEAGR